MDAETRSEVIRLIGEYGAGTVPPIWPMIRRGGGTLTPGALATMVRARAVSFDEFDGSWLDPAWTVTVAGTGNVNIVNGYRGGIVRLIDTGAAGAHDAEIANGTMRTVSGAGFPIYASAVQHGVIAVASGIRTQAGLRLAAVAFGAAGTYICFGFSATVSPNFLCMYANAGAPTVVDSGVAVPLGTFTDLMMKWNADGTVTFYINGVPVHTTPAGGTVPAAALDLEPYFAVDDAAAAVAPCAYDVDFYYCEQTREP